MMQKKRGKQPNKKKIYIYDNHPSLLKRKIHAPPQKKKKSCPIKPKKENKKNKKRSKKKEAPTKMKEELKISPKKKRKIRQSTCRRRGSSVI